MTIKNCNKLNLLNHCKQKNITCDIKIEYKLCSFNLYRKKREKELLLNKKNINHLSKLSSCLKHTLLWECTLTFVHNNKLSSYKYYDTRKVDALKNILVNIESKLLSILQSNN